MSNFSSSTEPNILIYGPGIDTLGGGERYLFAVADALSAKGRVVVAGPKLPSMQRLQDLGFGDRWPLGQISRSDFTAASADYDVAICQTIDLPPRSRARRSYLIVQFPSATLPGLRHPRAHFGQRRDLSTYKCVVYSEFVRRWLRELWNRDALLLPPPVHPGVYDPSRKRPGILSVGRFFGSGHSKRQDVLIEAYLSLSQSIQDRWPLTLAGGCGDSRSDRTYIEEIHRATANHNIEVATNVSPRTLDQMYTENSLFWHATGYGRSNAAPGQAEHFGISTIEAMSYGCVPMAFADGAQVEIVEPTFGILWNDIGELVRITAELIADPQRRSGMARGAQRASTNYTDSGFAVKCRSVFEVEE
jgi:glycosyltransferase involved in cell wall biosynthesis